MDVNTMCSQFLKRLWHVFPKRINPPSQPNRITGNIPPGCRIIIPMPVVMQPGLIIKILTGKAQRVVSLRYRGVSLLKCIVLTLPDDILLHIRNGVNRCQMIGM